MVFHFFCPQGHILEAEHEQVGQPAACPFCGIEMFIPAPLDHPSTGKPSTVELIQTFPSGGPALSLTEGPSEQTDTEIPANTGIQASIPEENTRAGQVEQSLVLEAPRGISSRAEPSQGVLHIPCPLGHILETPPEMLGMAVMCPMCQTTFEPQYEASQEYRQKREEMAAKAAERAARFWLQLAIGTAIVVLGGLIMLIIFAPH